MNEFEDLLNSVSQVEPGVVTAEVLTVDANKLVLPLLVLVLKGF